ncbi:hypothetical protein LK12_04910 [Novosphingobium malaysiense]|uniref:Uncharacterized protein n=1 Tax=Novosphingobium malaysiense TaxID=1348853 RepID=A0A0B1ZWP7_9SPHN|nr:hypothetical protein LK12_04910 [Novosphingobium malaysiense]
MWPAVITALVGVEGTPRLDRLGAFDLRFRVIRVTENFQIVRIVEIALQHSSQQPDMSGDMLHLGQPIKFICYIRETAETGRLRDYSDFNRICNPAAADWCCHTRMGRCVLVLFANAQGCRPPK